MKVILIGGYPGSGKSTVVKEFIKSLGGVEAFGPCHDYSMDYMMLGKLLIMGSYKDGEKFPGTDRFSMAIQPHFEQFLLDKDNADRVILLEGDRLFNSKTITFLWQNHIEYDIVVVRTDKNLVKARRNKRSAQSETWRKGRETKVDNIVKQMPRTQFISADTDESIQIGVKLLRKLTQNEKKKAVLSKRHSNRIQR